MRPRRWGDVRFLDGFPGKDVVMARQGDGHWYVAGINAQITTENLRLALNEPPVQGTATLITDGDGGNLSFRQQAVRLGADKMLDIALKPRCGFVLVSD
jgi:alpha-glucosidase